MSKNKANKKQLVGSDQSDIIFGGNGANTIIGGLGDDYLSGGNGADYISGGDGDDRIFGGNGADTISGGRGNNLIDGGNGPDTVLFALQSSNYTFFRLADGGVRVESASPEDGNTVIYNVEMLQFSDHLVKVADLHFSADISDNDAGGVDIDLREAAALSPALGTLEIDQVFYEGPDTLVLPDNIENVTLTGLLASSAIGNALDNILIGNDAANVLYAQGGDDTVFAGGGDDIVVAGNGEGDDTYDGGSGTDTITFTSTTLGVTVDLEDGYAVGPEIGNDQLSQFENVVGGDGNDTLYGDAFANMLNGGHGDDMISGRLGADVLTGGSGEDVFFGTLSELDGDTITDLGQDDRIVIQGADIQTSAIVIDQQADHALLQFLDEASNIVSTLRIDGQLVGVPQAVYDGAGTTTIRLVQPADPTLITFDDGALIENGFAYEENGFRVEGPGIPLSDSYPTDGSDLELTANRFGVQLMSDDRETLFSVLDFEAGVINPDQFSRLAFRATYDEESSASFFSPDAGLTWSSSETGEVIDDIYAALEGMRFLQITGTNYWIDDFSLV